MKIDDDDVDDDDDDDYDDDDDNAKCRMEDTENLRSRLRERRRTEERRKATEKEKREVLRLLMMIEVRGSIHISCKIKLDPASVLHCNAAGLHLRQRFYWIQRQEASQDQIQRQEWRRPGVN